MGFGTKQVIKVKTDSKGKMIIESLREEIAKARKEGKEPFFVNATSGTTVFGAFDSLTEIAQVCTEEKLWLHVDVSFIRNLLSSNYINAFDRLVGEEGSWFQKSINIFLKASRGNF